MANGSSGVVFALVDHANARGRGVLASVVGRGRAAELAQSVASRPGLVVVSALLYLQYVVSTEGSSSDWEIVLSSSGSSASATDAVRVTVEVGANTGEAKVQS